MNKPSTSRIELINVSQSFLSHEHRVDLFQGLSLSVEQGHSYAITGPSGSGKSTLLMLMSGLEQPSSGKGFYVVDGNTYPLTHLRRDIGFVFQQFHLLPELTALHNVALPLKLRGVKNAETLAKQWLEEVGLSHRLTHKPNQLSGGEQQRVAIARALVFEPKFIFADEPTGNLDSQSAKEIADLLFSCCQRYGAGLIMVTHSETLAARAQQVFHFQQGKVECLQPLNKELDYAL